MLYIAILESLEDAIISKDLNGVISYWNSAACRIFGYTKDEVIAQRITIIIPLDLRHEEDDILRQLRVGQRIDREARRVSKYGKILNVSITISPLRDSEGRIIGAAKSSREIREKKRDSHASAASVHSFADLIQLFRSHFHRQLVPCS